VSDFLPAEARLLGIPIASDSEVRRLLAVAGEDAGESIIALGASPEIDLGRWDEIEG
jgi:hypothetical protein